MESLSQRTQYAKPGVGHWYWDLRDREIIARIDRRKYDLHLLDAGCGEGITMERLIRERKNVKVAGIDCEVANVTVCQERGLPVNWGNIYFPEFPNGSMDYVLLTEVIEHLSNPQMALWQIHRLLRPGGRILVLFPNDRNFFLAQVALGMWRKAWTPSDHFQKLSPRKVISILRGTGFVVQECINLPFREIPWFASLHCLITARKPKCAKS